MRVDEGPGGEVLTGGDRVALADAVGAVLGLVVHRGGPLELEERDVRGARERDALRGDARRRAAELRAVALAARSGSACVMGWGRSGRWNARTASSRSPRASAPSRCAASGKRSSTARWMSTCLANTTSRSPAPKEE